MNYRLRSNPPGRRHSPRKLAFLGALVVGLIAVQAFVPDLLTGTLLSVASPFWKGGESIADGTRMLGAGVARSKSSLVRENEALAAENRDLRASVESLQSLAVQNEELRKMLGIARDGMTGTVAAVIAKPPLTPYDSIVVEAAQGTGFEVGDDIVAEGGVLLGEVSEVYGRRAIGRLYTSADAELDVMLERTGAVHRAHGVGGGNYELKIPREVDIEAGDMLVLPGLDRLIVAEVRQIDTDPAESFKRALARAPANIFQLKWVSVLGTLER